MMPDHTRETFRAGVSHGGHDGRDGYPAEYERRSLRYLEWSYDPNPEDTNYIVDFTYLLRDEPDHVQCIYDRHIVGLFSRETWLRLLTETGFIPSTQPFDHSECEIITEIFLGKKPG